MLYHKNIIEYYVPVILSEHRGLQALSLIIYEAMRQNKPKGRTTWNWGGNGASLDSVYRFKKSWGAVDLPYRYFTKINKKYPHSLDPNKLLSDYAGFYLYPFEQCQDRRDSEARSYDYAYRQPVTIDRSIPILLAHKRFN